MFKALDNYIPNPDPENDPKHKFIESLFYLLALVLFVLALELGKRGY
jgi:hypothetical protein